MRDRVPSQYNWAIVFLRNNGETFVDWQLANNDEVVAWAIIYALRSKGYKLNSVIRFKRWKDADQGA